jgi:hypothetical protein
MLDPQMRRLLAGSVFALMLTAGIAADDGAAAFQRELVQAIGKGSRQEVARLFAYPLRVTVPSLGLPVAVRDAAALVAMYDTLFTPEMHCAIEQSRLPTAGTSAPKYAMSTADGVITLAGGHVIAERKPAGFRITRITVLGQPSPARPPRKVVYGWGVGETQFAGTLSGNEVDGYVVSGKKGDLVQARIERFPGRSLLLRVTQVASKRVITGSPSEYARSWAARLDADGDYRVDVVHASGFCDAPVSYVVTIALRR